MGRGNFSYRRSRIFVIDRRVVQRLPENLVRNFRNPFVNDATMMSMRLWWLHAVALFLRIIFVLHFSLFCVNFHETWIFLWDQFFRFFFSFLFLFYSLISCLRCWWFLWDLSQYINPITLRWFPPLVHILWTVFALLDVFLSIRERSLRSAHAIQVFFDTIHAIWNWTRNQIREKKSIKKRSIIAKYLEKSLSGTREFWRINKSGKFCVGSLGWLVLALRL